MKIQSLITGFFLLLPVLSQAETIDLTCTDASGFTAYYEINTSQGAVSSSGQLARNVAITKNSIKFTLDMNGQAWFHSINRSTGNLNILSPDKIVLPSYKCEKAKPKF